MRHERDILIAERVFGRPPGYYDCPHVDNKTGRLLSFCSCPELPYYFNTMTAAWRVHCEMRIQPFDIREEYMEILREVVTNRMRKYANPPPGVMLTWPDVILFLEPYDICNAALGVMG